MKHFKTVRGTFHLNFDLEDANSVPHIPWFLTYIAYGLGVGRVGNTSHHSHAPGSAKRSPLPALRSSWFGTEWNVHRPSAGLGLSLCYSNITFTIQKSTTDREMSTPKKIDITFYYWALHSAAGTCSLLFWVTWVS